MKARFTPWFGLVLLAGMVTAATGTGDARLAGNWQLDAAGSDDFGTQLGNFLAAEDKDRQRRMRPIERRQPRELEAGAVLDDADPLEPDNSVRTRLTEALQPPAVLSITLNGNSVDLHSDTAGKRTLPLNEKMIRVDASGSAQITAQLAGRTLTINYRYLSRARQSQVYSLGNAPDTLQTTLTYVERNGSKLVVKSLYRRSP